MRNFDVESSAFLKIKELVVPGLSLEAFLIVPAAAAAAAAASAAAAATVIKQNANRQIQKQIRTEQNTLFVLRVGTNTFYVF